MTGPGINKMADRLTKVYAKSVLTLYKRAQERNLDITKGSGKQIYHDRLEKTLNAIVQNILKVDDTNEDVKSLISSISQITLTTDPNELVDSTTLENSIKQLIKLAMDPKNVRNKGNIQGRRELVRGMHLSDDDEEAIYILNKDNKWEAYKREPLGDKFSKDNLSSKERKKLSKMARENDYMKMLDIARYDDNTIDIKTYGK